MRHAGEDLRKFDGRALRLRKESEGGLKFFGQGVESADQVVNYGIPRF